ncbi:uncharacterized protein EAE97_009438 [Botrytis byssoidea]|uniref:Carboxylic ester hydrolase n=1 Tax=Botrytis byssoidea TaxID=139641 RepID=A0A9P5I539_9HELO|nr:uncharacterized protein EAE97_009438 [Botrytis byssoidea]KAF7929841.1 hypothetical protein EAE97_009438 [Botrytis byssoidea]
MSFNPFAAPACSSLPAPDLFGVMILPFKTDQVTNYTLVILMGLYMNDGAVEIQAASFCNFYIVILIPVLMIQSMYKSTCHLQNGTVGCKPLEYWNGCYQSGRQGMMLAQRFPEAFDEIAASAPAINRSGIFMQAITVAAITACDANDGLADEIVADPDFCGFDPTTLVGTTINCTEIGENFTVSSGAAYLTQTRWDGPRKSDNSSLYFGQKLGINNGTRTADPLSLLLPWIAKFVRIDDNTDTSSITRQESVQLYHSSINEWSSIINTNDPDLSRFLARGRKLPTYHGLADDITPPNSTTSYHDSVTALDPNLHDFYRALMGSRYRSRLWRTWYFHS